MTQTLASLKAVVGQCDYPGFIFKIGLDGDAEDPQGCYPWVQVISPDGIDTATGEPFPWKSRKWKLSYFMTDTEVVHTVWAMVQRALIHEASEMFTFQDQAIFDRHINVHALANLRADPDILDGRDEPEAPIA